MRSHMKYLIFGMVIASLVIIGITYVKTYSSDDETVMEYEDTYNNLIKAVEDNNVPRVIRLLREDIDPDIQDATGLAPLHYAAYHQNFEIINLLLAADADANIQDDERFTPLHAVADFNNIEIAQALVNAGANPYIENSEGRTPMDFANSDEMREVLNQR
ncbi:MAG: ankyrin repeat domain-containing protein [Candidatus Chromulinivorax sp.]|nr:ankyrin repeat domain-containing protein [Candidatus Chromulinivorax sp.]